MKKWLIGLMLTVAACTHARADKPSPSAAPDTHALGVGIAREQVDRELVFRTVVWNDAVARNQWIAWNEWAAEQERQAAAAAAAARVAERSRSAPVPARTPARASGGGSCYARKPAGFPDHVIDRESGGNPDAHNPSGAHGCAQLMPEHFQRGRACEGKSYDDCWSTLWDGGRGASNWSETI